MKEFGWSNISIMGFVLNLSVNGHHELSIFLGLVMSFYFYLKFSKWINLTTILSGVAFAIITMGLLFKVNLLVYSSSLIVISVYLGFNMGLFLTILLKSTAKKMNLITTSIHFYTLVLIVLIFLILVVPNHLLSYFLYPHYLDGGFKEAMFVIVCIIFGPYILMFNSYQLIQWVQGEATTSLVSTKSVIQ